MFLSRKKDGKKLNETKKNKKRKGKNNNKK